MSTIDQTYNGYKNFATWAVSMFLDGNYTHSGTADHVNEMVERIVRERNAQADDGEQPFYESYIADALFDYVLEYVEDQHIDVFIRASLAADLLRHCLGDVDWFTLASNKIEALSEN